MRYNSGVIRVSIDPLRKSGQYASVDYFENGFLIMSFPTRVEPPPFASFRESFLAAAEFAYALGVNRSNVRIQAYREFLDALSNDDLNKMEAIRSVRLWREVHEVTWVLSVFKDNAIEPPRELLAKAFDGRPLEDYEDESGRNFFLQLRAAIYFLRLGYAIALDDACDVVASRGRRRLFIECKRLYSEKKSKDRVRECYKQLETRLSTATKSKKNQGLAWVDPSPVMQKHYFLYTAYSEAGARQAARTDLVEFWKQWIAKEYDGTDNRIFATVLQMVWPSWVAGAKRVATGFTSCVFPSRLNSGLFNLWRVRRLLDEVLSIDDR
jgi:hypothetical protein